MQMNFKIVTPDGVIYEDAVESVSLPTMNGEITVLPHHIPLISVIKSGEIRITKDANVFGVAVSSGVLEVRESNEVIIIADTAERAEHIDIERAEIARKRAEELMQQEQFEDDIQFARLQAQMEKELARLRVGKKYRNIHI
jgi:F-type H+-transporting ATPase subunit epsilon